MPYTVKELALLAGVSARTLRYYDAIGLLPATRAGRNNDERQYDDGAVLRLQQILFYRELDFRLDEIRAILDDPAYDVLQALREQRTALMRRRTHIEALLRTLDNTVDHLEGRRSMTDEKFFEGFDHTQYEQEARERWGHEVVDESTRRWNARSRDEQERIRAEQESIFATILDAMDGGPADTRVQHAVERLHNSVNLFWDCGDDAFRGLGDLYVTDARFRATFEKMDPGMPEFLRTAMNLYCDRRANARA